MILHGATGAWDELIVLAIALGTLFVVMRLAGRGSSASDETDEEEPEVPSPLQERGSG